ncbi:MAG: DnaB-like helicase C-terminal domain-containing protein [Candidatus Sericytochromatia bacterium]|nr:DnaB-like helicase C-terminal domain-containing protein [Candidatus Sericytochromatia bacterium]
MTPSTTPHRRLLGPAFDALPAGLILVAAPPAVGKTCLSLNLAAHFAAHLGEDVLYFSPVTPREVVLARLAKNLTAEGEAVDVGIAADLPLCVLDAANPTSAGLLESAATYVEQHGQPGLVLVNDLQSLRPGRAGVAGVAAAVEILADMRAVAKVCRAPLVLFSQLAEGKGISTTVRDQADRVVQVSMTAEDAAFKHLEVHWADGPDPDGERYPMSLARATGLLHSVG